MFYRIAALKGIRKFPRKLSSLLVFFNVQYIYFYGMMAAPEKLNEEFVKLYHEELLSKAWSI